MSRIHQAIRRAEKEGRSDLSLQNIEQGRYREGTEKKILPPPTNPALLRSYPSEKNEPALNEEKPGYSELSISPDTNVVALSSPESSYAQHFRMLGAKLCQMRTGCQLKTVLMTSPASGEGKTLTVVNLALTMARENNHKVLLIDANLRNSSVHSVLGVGREKGLSDLVKEGLRGNEIVCSTNVSNFHVVKAGNIYENPTEIINTQRMRNFLSFSGKRFDWVFLDSPCILDYPDAELMSSFVDGVLLVVHASSTSAELLVEGVQTLKGKNVLGIILNGRQESHGL